MTLSPTSSRGGGSISVTDGSTTVDPATELDFTSGVTITDAGGGVADAAVSGGALQLLSTTTLTVNGTFDVSGISQAYTDLIAIIIARGTNATSADSLILRLNNDSGGNYYRDSMNVAATAATVTENLAATSLGAGGIPSASSTAGLFGVTEFLFPGYSSTTWQKVAWWRNFYSNANTSGTTLQNIALARWASTAAISRLTITGNLTANLLAGSVLRLYGRT